MLAGSLARTDSAQSVTLLMTGLATGASWPHLGHELHGVQEQRPLPLQLGRRRLAAVLVRHLAKPIQAAADAAPLPLHHQESD